MFLLPVVAGTANPLTGTFYGTAHISSPAAIANIDLVVCLDVTGNTFQQDTSCIDLKKTLIFPAVAPQIDGKDVGPRVSGTLSLTAFTLQTDDFTSKVGDATVTRSITLTGDTIKNGGNSLSGTYTEIISGMGPDDVTVSGTFILVKPTVASEVLVADLNGDNCLDLSEITAGGNDATAVEYSDVSFALHLYNTPSITPNLCSPAEDVVKQALSQYYGTLN